MSKKNANWAYLRMNCSSGGVNKMPARRFIRDFQGSFVKLLFRLGGCFDIIDKPVQRLFQRG